MSNETYIDLSKKPGSVTYEYLQVMPQMYAIQGDNTLTSKEKREKGLEIAIIALNNATKISTDTYDRKREELFNAGNINDLVRVMERVIINGKHAKSNLRSN